MSEGPLSALALKKWAIRGKVVHGHGRGGTMLGFPTANVELDEPTLKALAPMKNWVFFCWGIVEPNYNEVYPIALSVGFNPHFKDRDLSVEAHFIHKFPEDFYDANIRFVSCGALRSQAAFTTLEALIEMIQDDCKKTLESLEATEENRNIKKCSFLTNADHPAVAGKTLPVFISEIDE